MRSNRERLLKLHSGCPVQKYTEVRMLEMLLT